MSVTVTLYPDPDPEVTCCDGYVSAEGGYYGVDWAVLHDGVAFSGHATGSGLNIPLESGRNTDKWRRITRLFLLFDASPIPPGATIISAKLRVYGAGKLRALSAPLFGMAVVKSFPASNTNITKDDYQKIGTTLLSNTIILFDDYDPAGWNEFPLNTAGLEAITPGEIVKLGIRDRGYDISNSPPPWEKSYGIVMAFDSADLPNETAPQLVVTYMPVPTVTTDPATSIGTTSSTPNGTLDADGGEACDCGFEWGLTDAYGHTTLTESKVTGESFSRAIGGLTPGTTYHFRAFATNSAGTGYGADRTFTTEALPPAVIIPTVTTEPATLISQVSATLNSFLNDDGGEACQCGFEWGLTDAYGHTTLTESKVTGESFSRAIGGLTPGTTYHFRAFATNSAGTGYGADRSFTSTPTFSRAHALSREEL